MVKKLLVALFLSLLVVGCGNQTSSDNDFFDNYKNTLIGDNSSVGAIIDSLHWESELTSFSLETNAQPYGLNLYFNGVEQPQTMIENAAYLFTLIGNLDYVVYDTSDALLQIFRQDLETQLNTSFEPITQRSVLEDILNQHDLVDIYNNLPKG